MFVMLCRERLAEMNLKNIKDEFKGVREPNFVQKIFFLLKFKNYNILAFLPRSLIIF